MMWVCARAVRSFTVTIRRILRRRETAARTRAHIHILMRARRPVDGERQVALRDGRNSGTGAIGHVGWTRRTGVVAVRRLVDRSLL